MKCILSHNSHFCFTILIPGLFFKLLQYFLSRTYFSRRLFHRFCTAIEFVPVRLARCSQVSPRPVLNSFDFRSQITGFFSIKSMNCWSFIILYGFNVSKFLVLSLFFVCWNGSEINSICNVQPGLFGRLNEVSIVAASQERRGQLEHSLGELTEKRLTKNWCLRNCSFLAFCTFF
jgi:hypothetical protein